MRASDYESFYSTPKIQLGWLNLPHLSTLERDSNKRLLIMIIIILQVFGSGSVTLPLPKTCKMMMIMIRRRLFESRYRV